MADEENLEEQPPVKEEEAKSFVEKVGEATKDSPIVQFVVMPIAVFFQFFIDLIEGNEKSKGQEQGEGFGEGGPDGQGITLDQLLDQFKGMEAEDIVNLLKESGITAENFDTFLENNEITPEVLSQKFKEKGLDKEKMRNVLKQLGVEESKMEEFGVEAPLSKKLMKEVDGLGLLEEKPNGGIGTIGGIDANKNKIEYAGEVKEGETPPPGHTPPPGGKKEEQGLEVK